ncbi:hypothetical protein K488DRAFT_52295 [Vararia minispora EC-137]|uniref:Uncharacterized protein n=1 Tax=Vararia minispora EC-137 TaxID=1314806 RepID=A0ACB8QHX8_9AGAM|nr:hypothetical protein K488DRAFT_52295 [Vararia minispora EC-137]
MIAWLFVSLLALASKALAIPAALTQSGQCSVPASILKGIIPSSDQSTLIPPSTHPKFVALGIGVQNYTCSSSGAFANIGAVAQLFDISCLYDTRVFDLVQSEAFARWNASASTEPKSAATVGGRTLTFLGDHYFIANLTGSGSNVPEFDFRTGALKDNTNGFVLGSKVGDVVSPSGSANVDWLMLNATNAGAFAQTIFRVNTVAGVAPGSCTDGQTVSMKYAAKYCAFPYVAFLCPAQPHF